ncbi:hypothetical protein FPCIR_5147 [Fusarium pseudocircinatum]|uniref:F-box domain-containing protein n=1 Tax=Fusarium pseudocircinatum TaxID=56676 RepID=A0A8H5PBW4_9HYPO|nr:hypothetical protein FPCIR_5147 [Fusarium pseudocircinatum]
MVQLLADPAFSPAGTPTHEGTNGPLMKRPGPVRADSSTPMTREEHAKRMQELNNKRGLMRAPRRGWSMTDYQGDHVAGSHSGASHIERQAPIPENESPPPSTPHQHSTPEVPAEDKAAGLPHRPKLPPPRRSYSVMDYEPVPQTQPQPPKDHTLLDLPSELHYTIFDHLDPIDSVCFGLTNSNFYDIHRRLHGTVPLSSRYSGPNDMEWAWRGAGPLVHRHERNPEKEDPMGQMRVKGQVYCRKCGISRCELHRHLKDWMGDGYEYCSIKEIFGKPAGEDAKPYCYMKSPKNPHRCGRHGGKQGTL